MIIRIALSCNTFGSFEIYRNLDWFSIRNPNDVINEIVYTLKMELTKLNLEVLVNQLNTYKYHIHSCTIDQIRSGVIDTIYVCNCNYEMSNDLIL